MADITANQTSKLPFGCSATGWTGDGRDRLSPSPCSSPPCSSRAGWGKGRNRPVCRVWASKAPKGTPPARASNEGGFPVLLWLTVVLGNQSLHITKYQKNILKVIRYSKKSFLLPPHPPPQYFIFFSQIKCEVKVTQSCPSPWCIQSMEFSRPESWSG